MKFRLLLTGLVFCFAAPSVSSAAPPPGFDTETVWSGFDDWEPTVATDPITADIYQLTVRLNGPQPCVKCTAAKLVFRRSSDAGASRGPDSFVSPSSGRQIDPQIAVASSSGQDVYVALRLSNATGGAAYKTAAGYAFPYGDYFGLAVDAFGNNHVVWGEGTGILSGGGAGTRGASRFVGSEDPDANRVPRPVPHPMSTPRLTERALTEPRVAACAADALTANELFTTGHH